MPAWCLLLVLKELFHGETDVFALQVGNQHSEKSHSQLENMLKLKPTSLNS